VDKRDLPALMEGLRRIVMATDQTAVDKAMRVWLQRWSGRYPRLAPQIERSRSFLLRSRYIDGAKINIVFSDLGYKREKLKDFRWAVPKDVTIMIDSARIADGKFEALIDMSKDPQMYAFAKKKYRLTLTFDPREAPDFIQDRIGWHGEGLTDKNYLDTKTIPGVRRIRREWVIDRADLM